MSARPVSAQQLVTKSRLKSTWTPLNNEKANDQLYDERQDLVLKWFESWNDKQRAIFLQEILHRCRRTHLEFVHAIVTPRVPEKRYDFTLKLPRALNLYIFSFLDARSLSRASQVCAYWKFLSEADEIWMPKCLRIGWLLPFSPSPFEHGVWKRNYIENVTQMQHVTKLQQQVNQLRLELDNEGTPRPTVSMHDLNSSTRRTQSNRATNRSSQRPQSGIAKVANNAADSRPPWRANDPVAKDTLRYNYLENDVSYADRRKRIDRKPKLKRELGMSATFLQQTGPNDSAGVAAAMREVAGGFDDVELNEFGVGASSAAATGGNSMTSSRLMSYDKSDRPDWAKPPQSATKNVAAKSDDVVLTNSKMKMVSGDAQASGRAGSEKLSSRPWIMPEGENW